MKISAASVLRIACSAMVVSAVFLSAVSALGQIATATAVHTFTGPDGTAPTSIIQASDGNLWGTTAQGGANNLGTVFKIYPDGTLITVYDFASASNTQLALQPVGLIESGDGNFYGVTQYGGYGVSGQGYCACGTFFRLTPDGQFTILYAFGEPYSENPNPGLLQGSDGNFYISTVYGPVVISPAGTPLDFGQVSLMPIVSAGLLEHSNGTFYGASANYGVVYSYSLQHGLNLYNEDTGIGLGYTFAEGTDGNIYGAGNNLAFRFTPSGSYKTFSTNFNAATGLTPASDGNVYGMYALGSSAPLFDITVNGQVEAIPTTGGPDINSSSYRITPVQASDGSFLAPFADDGSGDNAIYRYSLTPPLLAPIRLTPSASTIALGASFTLTWHVLNATSATLQQCNAFLTNNGTGGGNWTGLQPGTRSNGLFSGSATLTPTAGGTYTYALTCGGVESGYASVTVTGGTASPTTTVLLASPSAVPAGSPVTLTAAVTSNTGGATPTGHVTFYDGSRALASATLTSYGVATYTAPSGLTRNLPGGTYNLTARYSGDTNDSASTSAAVPVTVEGTSTTALVLASNVAPLGYDYDVFTATVQAVHGGPTPTGNVQFNSTGQGNPYSFGSVSLNPSGVATLTGPNLPVTAGTYAITATYLGDSNNQPSTSPAVTLYVTSPTTTALAVYPASVKPGHYVTFTATLTALDNNIVSGGTVTFTSGSITAATATVNANGIASANVLVRDISPGTYPIVANYLGTTIYGPSISTAVNVTVTR